MRQKLGKTKHQRQIFDSDKRMSECCAALHGNPSEREREKKKYREREREREGHRKRYINEGGSSPPAVPPAVYWTVSLWIFKRVAPFAGE